jgi:hypothetical protein
MLSLLTQSIVVGSQNKYERSQFVEGNFLEVTNITKPSVIKILATSVKGDLSYSSFRQYSIRIGFKGEYLRYGSYYYVLIEKDYLVRYDYPIFKRCKPISEERFLEFLNYYRKPLNIVDLKIEYEDFQEFILQDVIDKGIDNCIYLELKPDNNQSGKIEKRDFRKTMFIYSMNDRVEHRASKLEVIRSMREKINKPIWLRRIAIYFSKYFFATYGGEIQNALSNIYLLNSDGSNKTSNYQYIYLAKDEDKSKIDNMLIRVIEKKIEKNLKNLASKPASPQ